MDKKDIIKLIVISFIIMCLMLTILIILSENYIVDHTRVAEVNSKQIVANAEPTVCPTDKGLKPIQTPAAIPEPTAKPTPTPTVRPTKTPITTPTPPAVKSPEVVDSETYSSKYYIKVNNQMNTVTVYTKDENGEYTKPIKAMICSTGEETPQNCTHNLTYKRWEWRPLFGNVQGHYTTQINGHILFHSVPYLQQSNNTLEYWEYDKLGTTASAGCVRLTVEDAKWIYENCLQGTPVEFYNSPDPGPLGKPTAMKISDYIEYRDWDPTDPNENNPWNNIL